MAQKKLGKSKTLVVKGSLFIGAAVIALSLLVGRVALNQSTDNRSQAAEATAQPNLIVTGYRLEPATPTFKKPFTIRVTIKNIGTAATSKFTTGFSIGNQMTNRTSYGLAPGQETVLEWKKVRVLTPRFDLNVSVDSQLQVSESNEADNLTTYSIDLNSVTATPTPTPITQIINTPVPTSTPTVPAKAQVSLYSEYRFDPQTDCTADTCLLTYVSWLTNTGNVQLSSIRVGDLMTGSNWYPTFTKPFVESLTVDGPLAKNPSFTGCSVTDANLPNCSILNDPSTANTLPVGSVATFIMKVRVARSQYDVPVNNLITFNGTDAANANGIYLQAYAADSSGMQKAVTIPKK